MANLMRLLKECSGAIVETNGLIERESNRTELIAGIALIGWIFTGRNSRACELMILGGVRSTFIGTCMGESGEFWK